MRDVPRTAPASAVFSGEPDNGAAGTRTPSVLFCRESQDDPTPGLRSSSSCERRGVPGAVLTADAAAVREDENAMVGCGVA